MLGADYDQDLSPRSSRWPQRTEDSTYGRAFRPRRLFRCQARRQKASTAAATTTAMAVRWVIISTRWQERNLRPSISRPAEAPKPDKSRSDKDDKCTPAPWVSPELYETRKSERKCIRWGSPKHKTFRCMKYTPTNFPENLAPPGDGKQIQRKRSFDSQQPKN